MGAPKMAEMPLLTGVKSNSSKFGGGFVGVIGQNEFRLYLKLDLTNFGVSIVNFDYLRHSRLIGEGYRAIIGLLSRFCLQRSSRATRATRGQ